VEHGCDYSLMVAHHHGYTGCTTLYDTAGPSHLRAGSDEHSWTWNGVYTVKTCPVSQFLGQHSILFAATSTTNKSPYAGLTGRSSTPNTLADSAPIVTNVSTSGPVSAGSSPKNQALLVKNSFDPLIDDTAEEAVVNVKELKDGKMVVIDIAPVVTPVKQLSVLEKFKQIKHAKEMAESEAKLNRTRQLASDGLLLLGLCVKEAFPTCSWKKLMDAKYSDYEALVSELNASVNGIAYFVDVCKAIDTITENFGQNLFLQTCEGWKGKIGPSKQSNPAWDLSVGLIPKDRQTSVLELIAEDEEFAKRIHTLAESARNTANKAVNRKERQKNADKVVKGSVEVKDVPPPVAPSNEGKRQQSKPVSLSHKQDTGVKRSDFSLDANSGLSRKDAAMKDKELAMKAHREGMFAPKWTKSMGQLIHGKDNKESESPTELIGFKTSLNNKYSHEFVTGTTGRWQRVQICIPPGESLSNPEKMRNVKTRIPKGFEVVKGVGNLVVPSDLKLPSLKAVLLFEFETYHAEMNSVIVEKVKCSFEQLCKMMMTAGSAITVRRALVSTAKIHSPVSDTLQTGVSALMDTAEDNASERTGHDSDDESDENQRGKDKSDRPSLNDD